MHKFYSPISKVILILSILSLIACGGGSSDGDAVARVSDDAALASLTLTGVDLDQIFQPAQLDYSASSGFLDASVHLDTTTSDPNATVRVNGTLIGISGDDLALAEGANAFNIEVTAEDGVTTRVYTLEVTRGAANTFAQRAYAKASNTGTDDLFGYSVAIDGDTLAVGSKHDDSNGTGVNGGGQADNSAVDSGAVYVFTLTGGVWSQQAYVKASNTGTMDFFGESLALDGDTLAVGARREDSNGTGVNGGGQADDSVAQAGAVYVYTRSGGVWSQQAYVKASNTDAGDNFGVSVALAGDTLAVGAFVEGSNGTGVNGGGQADDSAGGSGAAYVFTRSGGVWSQQAYVKASNPDQGDYFGVSVALDGDTLAVGAMGEASNGTGVNGGGQADNSAGGSGAAYVFTRSGGVWNQQAYVKASNTEANDKYGFSVALDGDTLAVGAFNEDSNGTGVNGGSQADNSAGGSGAAYVFTRSGGVWNQQAYVKASNSGAGGDQFGYSVALAGDTLAVGAVSESSNGTGINGGGQADDSVAQAGAVYVFTRSGGVWSQQAYVKASNTDAGDHFGWSISLGGDTLAVGARYESSNDTGVNGGGQADNSALNAGAVYILR